MIAIDSVQRTIILVKKYGLYVFVPLFLLIAYCYTGSTFQQYRVSARIELKNITASEAAAGLHSEYLVKQALDELNFHASYYDAQSPRDELYGSEVAVRLKFDDARKANIHESWMNLDITGTGSYTLTDEDTTAYYNFNEPVHTSSGNFIVTRRPGNAHTQASYLVHLDDPDQQLDAYYQNLRIEPAGDGRSLSISFLSGNPRKGAAFVNKLLQLYGGKAPDRHGDLVNAKFSLVEKPDDNFESTTLSPLWFYFVALVAGLAIPLGFPLLRKKHSPPLPGWVFTLPKMVDYIIQHGFAFKQAD